MNSLLLNSNSIHILNNKVSCNSHNIWVQMVILNILSNQTMLNNHRTHTMLMEWITNTCKINLM